MTNNFYKGLDGVMLVFDLTDEKSFHNLKKWLNQIKPCPYFIAGNKSDLQNERIIDDSLIETLEN